MISRMANQPSLYIPHGGGPCFFMDDPAGNWRGMAAFLRALPATLPAPPKAILMVSGHWETAGFALTAAAKPPLIYDYYGFPPHTYALRYDVPGLPALAAEAAQLLRGAGYTAALDAERGIDHGVFVPLKVAYPDADVPVVELSLDRNLDVAMHVGAGRALAPLRARGMLILGAGMSFHNLRALGDPRATAPSEAFDRWLTDAVALPGERRAEQLAGWAAAPAARIAHPREEHLLPLVAAGASESVGRQVYSERVLEVAIAGYRFD